MYSVTTPTLHMSAEPVIVCNLITSGAEGRERMQVNELENEGSGCGGVTHIIREFRHKLKLIVCI